MPMIKNHVLFDMPAFDKSDKPGDQQVQSLGLCKASSIADFQEFCQEFASTGCENGFEVQPVAAVLDHQLDGQGSFKSLGSADGSFHDMVHFSVNNDSQVVPDMAPPASCDSDLTAPAFAYSMRQTDLPLIGLHRYSCTPGTGCLPFDYSARPRLSDPQPRKQSLNRYREKKARRYLNSTKIRYELRKVNADKRPRIKGRFVKPEDLQQHLLQDALASTHVNL